MRRVNAGRVLFAALVALGLAGTANAATDYWDGTGGSWSATFDWSTASGATTPNPSAVPGQYDNAIFNITTVNSAEAVTLDAAQAVGSLTFNGTGGTTIQTGSGMNTLSLYGNLTANQNATISSGLKLYGAEAWTAASSGTMTVNGTVTRDIQRRGQFLHHRHVQRHGLARCHRHHRRQFKRHHF